MLKPNFEFSQSEEELVLSIHVPLANVAKTEISVVEDLIVFYSHPYYLRLHLPGHITEKTTNFSKFDFEKSIFTFTFTKVTPGQHFANLHLKGGLGHPCRKYDLKPQIEVLAESKAEPDPESDEEELFSYIRQEIEDVSSEELCNYGFANKGSGLGKNVMYEFKDIFELVHFENALTEDRSDLQVSDEQMKFSEDHYLADYMESEDVINLIEWNSPFKDNLTKGCNVKLTLHEKGIIKDIGNRDYLLDKKEKKIVLLSLVDILFAYAYNHRTTFGESSPESAWTINKLSSTFSWLRSFNSMKEVKMACARRSLIFPFYRHWGLAMTIFDDTLNILKSGRLQILKCLIEIYELFNESEPRYVLNDLYLKDYCVWIQKVSDKKVECLVKMFEEVQIQKSDVELELDELEEAALIVKEEEEVFEIFRKLNNMTLEEDNSGEEDSEEESDSSEIEDNSYIESSSPESCSSSSFDSDDFSDSE